MATYVTPEGTTLTGTAALTVTATTQTGGSTTGGSTSGQGQIIVTPSTATIPEGSTQQYTDQYYPQGLSQGNSQDVTTQSSWSDAYSDVASIGASTGLATGEAPGNASIEAIFTPPGGTVLTGTASLAVTLPQTQPSKGGSAGLSLVAVNQATWSTTPLVTQMGAPAQKVTRPVNTAKWTDQITATLTTTQPTPPASAIPSGGVVQSVTWSIQSASISYPQKNPAFAVGNPIDPAAGATTSQPMTPNGQQATSQFLEEWSIDGFGVGVYDILTNTVIAKNPSTWPITATYTLSCTVSGYVPTPESTPDGGTTIVDVPFGPIPFTVSGSAEQDLTVDGAGAMPSTSGDTRIIVSTN